MKGFGKIAAVTVAVGLMVAAIVGMTVRQVPPRSLPPGTNHASPAIDTARLARCRTLTSPDAECAAAWDAARARFFRDDVR